MFFLNKIQQNLEFIIIINFLVFQKLYNRFKIIL